MSLFQIDDMWQTFIALVLEINPRSARTLQLKYRQSFFKNPNKFAHADPAEILRRLFSWGDKDTIGYRHWQNIYVSLGGTIDVNVNAFPGD